MRSTALIIGSWLCLVPAVSADSHSELWGRKGEKWSSAGRLPDVSYAGYACGERPLPKVPISANVRDFGARGDGKTDDTDAFLAAIAKAKPGAISIPAGRYKITKILEIKRPGIVLRGAGAEQSVLVCPVPLNDIVPNWGETTSGQRTSNYSWSGGIVWFKGKNAGKTIGRCVETAKRGSRELRVDGDLSKIKPGSWIEIGVTDDANKTLLDHLYSGDPGNVDKIKAGRHSTSFVTRVLSAEDGVLKIERPLRIDIRPEWKPVVTAFEPTVTMGGIEEIGFEFPQRKYGGHFSELGFNAVAFSGVAHCWAKNLNIINSDSGIFAAGRFCTIDGLKIGTRGVVENNREFGHHGVTLSGHDNLCTRFEIKQRFIHDISVEGGAGNVASCGSGTDLCFDHHKRAPYENVFTNIDLGEGSRMWKSGGGGDLGRNSGVRGTFWNIRAKQKQKHPGGFGPPSLNLVAVYSAEDSKCDREGKWMEVIPPSEIDPPDIHQAQLKARLARK